MKFEDVYHSHKKMVFNLALQYAQNYEDAEEIAQDTFVAVHKSLPNLEENAQVSTWVYRIAINKSLDFIKAKKRKKRFAFFTNLFFDDGINIAHDTPVFNHPGVLLEDKEALAILFSHINALPDSQKTALILLKIEERSQVEAAEIMQISVKAIESLLQRAKANLTKKIKI